MKFLMAAGAAAVAFLGTSAAAQSFGGASPSDLLGYRSGAGHYRPSIGNRNRPSQTRSATGRRSGAAARPAWTRPPAGQNGGAATGSTFFRPAGPPIMPRQFAARFTRDRAGAESYLNSLLDDYHMLLQRRRARPYDVSRAASFLISVSYFVLHSRELSEAQFGGLWSQLGEAIGGDPQFQRLSNQEKQALYERYAILAMYMNASYSLAAREGDRQELANLRRMATEQLQAAFDLPANRLAFTARGVEVR